jgi:16S rRNA (uracil1498-N3)-methyltransferase
VHRFYIPPENWNPGALALTSAEAHHARDVLRLKRGDKLVVFNGRGREITAEIVDLVRHGTDSPGRARDEIRLRKLHEAETPPVRCRITLGQAIPKGKNMDLIVQKAVEIGAAEVAPILSDRTVVDVDLEGAAQKQAKWQQVAIEAAKQCGQNWLPQVRTPRELKDFFSAVDSVAAVSDRRINAADAQRAPLQELRLIGSLQSDARHLKKILADYSSEHGQLPTIVLMLVGPEGDFTPAELALARSHGCRPITLGPVVLRVETAAIYCLSILSYELLM